MRAFVRTSSLMTSQTGNVPSASPASIGVAAVFILTSLAGNCPLYSILGIRTCRAA